MESSNSMHRPRITELAPKLPALAAGLASILFLLYGHFSLSGRIQSIYSNKLQNAQATWQAKIEVADRSELSRLATKLNLIHQRLASLEPTPQHFFEWSIFRLEAATLLKEGTASATLQNDTAHISDSLLPEAKATLKQLSVGESEFRDRASLRLTSALFDEGMAEFGVANAVELVEELGGLVEDEDAQLSDVEKREAASLLNRLVLEAAWRNENGVLAVTGLPEDLDVEQKLTASATWLSQEECELFGKLFAAYGLDYAETVEGTVSAKDSDFDAKDASDSNSTRALWREEFPKLQRLCLKGQWQELSLQLAKGGTDNDKALAAGTARTLCRLLCSPWADQQPEDAKLEIALELVARQGPHLPEFAEVIWACSVSQLDEGGDLLNAVTAQHAIAPISKQALSAISAGSSAMLKHSVFAISNALEDRDSVAKSHLQLIKRGGGNLSFVARAVLRHIQVINLNQAREADGDASVDELTNDDRLALERLEKLLQAVTLYEKESGLNWFALASLDLKLERLDEAKSAAEKAAELLGEIPAVDQMLQTIKDAEKAAAQVN